VPTQPPTELTLNFLHWFNQIGKTPTQITKDAVAKYIATDISFFLNGKQFAHGLDEYYERLLALFKEIKLLEINFPVTNLISTAQQAAVNYTETLFFQDGSSQFIVNAMFLHFDNAGKICKLYDVFSGADPAQH
jgi:hypothetical protein